MAVTARSLQLPESMTNGGMAVPDAGHDLVMLLTSHPVTIRIDAEPPGPEVPDDLQAIVMRCLEKEPARRFASCEELEQALGQCASADLWTRHQAADWWRENVGSAASSGTRVLVG